MVTRRDHRRQQTIDEIKDTARSQLAGAGPAGISMRAIARHLAMTASAVHYYFPSHQALLDALIVDGFTSLGEALRIAYEGAGRRLPGERWLAVCRAHRAWSLDHQAEYLLLYGYEGACAVQQRNSQIEYAFSHVVNVLYAIMREAVAAGEIDTERIAAATSASLRKQLAAWRDQKDQRGDLPDGALAACMIAYAQLHGAINLELLGHVPPPLADHGALFELEMAHAYTALCRQPRPVHQKKADQGAR
jgi:AcrR family transcriptional regulator